MRYGHFDDERREYVITRPDTPLPWINYLGSEDFFGIISNTAGGYAFYRDARLRRLTRYRYNNAPLDLGGRYLYVRDDATGDYWSPSWQPTQRDLEDYACRHGLGYTIISSRRRGIRAETLYFVPARRDPRGLAAAADERAGRAGAALRSSARSSSASGTPRTTPPTSSATTPSARWRSRTASSTTRPSTASGATTSPTSPAPSRWPGSTRSATRSWGRTAAGIARSRSSGAPRPTRSRTAGSRRARTTSASSSQPGRDARGRSSSSATPRTRRTPSSIRPGSQTIDKRGVGRPSTGTWSPPRSPRRSPALQERWSDLLDDLPGPDRERARRPRWSTSGTRTSAWSPSTCRARRRCSSRGSAVGWDSATRARTCWASST